MLLLFKIIYEFKKLKLDLCIFSPHIMESMAVWDFGFNIVYSGFQKLDFSLCQWNVDSGLQSLVGFRFL